MHFVVDDFLYHLTIHAEDLKPLWELMPRKPPIETPIFGLLSMPTAATFDVVYGESKQVAVRSQVLTKWICACHCSVRVMRNRKFLEFLSLSAAGEPPLKGPVFSPLFTPGLRMSSVPSLLPLVDASIAITTPLLENGRSTIFLGELDSTH